jgi:hypothetical protein
MVFIFSSNAGASISQEKEFCNEWMDPGFAAAFSRKEPPTSKKLAKKILLRENRRENIRLTVIIK